MIRALPMLVVLVLAVFCLVDAISSRDDDVRNLPRFVWILLILFFPLIGSIAWLAAGRPVAMAPRRGERAMPEFPEYDRPGRAAAVDPEADAEFLRKIRERAEEQRRKAAELKRLEAERERQAREQREQQEPEES